MLKGAMSETRIEKRIVISGDTEIDHDQVTFSQTEGQSRCGGIKLSQAAGQEPGPVLV